MAFFTSQQLFGNGAGAPGGPGWVPIDLAAPPTYSANNRGIAFGEQLTSAIANRPHYALSLNDDDLNTRLSAFEVGGLDAAYDNGTIGPAGGGRTITKDGGAVETQSALGAQYFDDVANAHFRAQQIGDAVRGGVGFESVSFAKLGAGALAGFIDRRVVDFNNYSIITNPVAATLNAGGLAPADVLVGAGRFRDGLNNTDLIKYYDLVEVIGGTQPGLYVMTAWPTTTSATLVKLDGTVPAFAISEVVSIRVCRPIFGSFNIFGSNGVHNLQDICVSGVPTQESAFDILAGSTLGRHDTVGTSPDGARYAMRVRWKPVGGTPLTKYSVDAQGQARSTVASDQLTLAQYLAFADFDSAAFHVRQDQSTQAEAGYVARSNGFMKQWFGMTTQGDARPATTPAGVFAFNFINLLPFNVLLADITAADWQVSPDITLVEIITPAVNAGVYQVIARDVNNGRLGLSEIDGSGTLIFPVAGAGTLRILYGASLGGRDCSVGASIFTGWSTYARAGAVLQAPKQVGGTALLLEAGNRNVDPTNYWLVRGVRANDGSTEEVFGVTSEGYVGAIQFQATNNYTYRTAKTFRHTFPGMTAQKVVTAFTEGYVINTADPELFVLGLATADHIIKVTDETAGSWAGTWSVHLPHGAVVTKIGARYTSVAGSGPVADDLRFTLCSKQIGAGVLSMKAGAPNYFALTTDGTTRDDEFVLTETLLNRTVNNDMFGTGRTWFLWMARPATSAGDYAIIIHSIWVEYTMTTLAGA